MNHFDALKINKINGYVKYYLNNLYKLDWDMILQYYKKLFKFNFNYNPEKDPLNIIIDIGINLFDYNSNYIYAGSELIINYNTNKIIKFIKNNFNFKKCFIIYVNDKFDFKSPFIDKFYKTKYDTTTLSVKSIKSNVFNKNTSILDKKPKFIKNLKDNIPYKISNIWFASTSKFKEPNVYGYIFFDFFNYLNSPRDNLICIIFYNIINELIKKKYEDYINIGFNVSLGFNNLYKILNITIKSLNSGFKLFLKK